MFAGGVIQPLDLIQVMMIELFIERLKDPGDIRKVHDPTRMLLDRSRDVNPDPERMAMQPPAFVVFRNIRQMVRRFNGKNLEYFHGNKIKRNSDRSSLTAFLCPENNRGTHCIICRRWNGSVPRIRQILRLIYEMDRINRIFRGMHAR